MSELLNGDTALKKHQRCMKQYKYYLDSVQQLFKSIRSISVFSVVWEKKLLLLLRQLFICSYAVIMSYMYHRSEEY